METIAPIARRFINEYNGPQVAICAIGAGSLLNAITVFPGAARVIDSVINPYSENRRDEYINLYDHKLKSVSLEMLQELDAMTEIMTPGCARIVITGAVVSQRWRRGLDHAYISLNGRYFYVELTKMTEEEHKAATPAEIEAYRLKQDSAITNWALMSFLCNGNSFFYNYPGIKDVTPLTRSLSTAVVRS